MLQQQQQRNLVNEDAGRLCPERRVTAGEPFPNTMYTPSNIAGNDKEIFFPALCFMSEASGTAGELKE